MVFWPPNGTPKSIKFASKMKSKKQQPWEPKFNGFRPNLGLENRPKIVPVRGKWISWKTLFLLGKIKVFQLWGPPEIIKFAARNEDVKQTAPKLEISTIFGAFWPLKSTRKAMQNRVCFATLCNSPAPRRKSARAGAFGLSIWLFIWLGLVDLLLVALIIRVGCSEGHVTRRLQA